MNIIQWMARKASRWSSAFKYSFQGLKSAWEHEAAFKEEAIALIFSVPAAFWLGENALEKGLLIGSLLMILIVELLNSGIEAAIDRMGNEYHVLSGRAKDLGSAAVLMGLVMAALIWGMFLFEKLCA